MPVPTYDQLIAPLLRVLLAEPVGLKASMAQDQVAREAIEFARNVPQSIVLVDGERLGRLMIDSEGVGASPRTIKVPKVDGDYFEEG